MTTPDYPWDEIHHLSFFLHQEALQLVPSLGMCTLEAKFFMPHGHINWFKHPIISLVSFKQGYMAIIYATIQVDISVMLGVKEYILLEAAYSPKEVVSYKSLSQEFHEIFT
jgi:hypothetical protein